MGKQARKLVETRAELKRLKQFAREIKSIKLFRAARFALQLDNKRGALKVNPGEIVQIALFIETHLPKFIEKGDYYLKQSSTGLPRKLEYDPESGKTFILLDGVKGSFIGAGCRKRVVRSILYDYLHPQIVARGEQKLNSRELRVSKILKGGRGLFKTRALTQHSENGQEFATIYSDIINPGSFKTIAEERITFSLREKMKIAEGILRGLTTMHRRNVVHRDLGLGNYLVSITKTKSGKKVVKGVLSDFGSSMEISRAHNVIPQANTSYTAPEGLFFQKMAGSDYFSTDVFAAGCAFYNLFYGHMPAWTKKRYLRRTSTPMEQNYKELIEKIDLITKARREELMQKKQQNLISPGDAFELLILKMLHPDHTKRGTSTELLHEMQGILKMPRRQNVKKII